MNYWASLDLLFNALDALTLAAQCLGFALMYMAALASLCCLIEAADRRFVAWRERRREVPEDIQ